MLHAAIARPEKVVALIGIATAADALVTQFHALPVEVSHEPFGNPSDCLLTFFCLFSLGICTGCVCLTIVTHLLSLLLFCAVSCLRFPFLMAPCKHSVKYVSHVSEVMLHTFYFSFIFFIPFT